MKTAGYSNAAEADAPKIKARSIASPGKFVGSIPSDQHAWAGPHPAEVMASGSTVAAGSAAFSSPGRAARTAHTAVSKDAAWPW
jgi:hypothetical protein